MSSLIVEVCTVDKMEKHPNADRLSIATVKGWSCIVGLDQYKVGDRVIFVPPDSIMPSTLIEKYNLEYLKHNGRVGTAKLRGYISQGLVLEVPKGNWKLGDNVAEALGITKYEPPAPSYSVGNQQTSRKKLNPAFDKYTEIENIKNFNTVFKEGDEVVITEKIHGTNARFGNLEIYIGKENTLLHKISLWFKKYVLKQTHEFVYGSHNVQLVSFTSRMNFYGGDIWGEIAKRYKLAKIIPPETIVYAEIYGKGIQDLTYGCEGHEFAVFDIKQNGKYLDWKKVEEFCKEKNLPIVPVLYIGKYSDEILAKMTEGDSTICPTQMREGCVVKMLVEENNLQIGRKILKSVSANYLLRKNGTEYQ